MDERIQLWKVGGIAALALLSVYFLVPTITNLGVAPKWVQAIFPKKKINLGLDLRGGIHLVLGVDLKKAHLDSVDRLATPIKKDLEGEGIAVSDIQRKGDVPELSLLLQTNEAQKSAKERLSESWSQFTVEEGSEPNGLRLLLAEDEQKRIAKEAVDQSIETIRNRIDEFGVTEPSIRAQGDDRLVVQLPGVTDPGRAKELIGKTARLEFKLVDTSVKPEELVSRVQEAEEKLGIKPEERGVYSAYREKVNRYLKDRLPSGTEIVFEKVKEDWRPYLLQLAASVTGDHLETASVQIDRTQFNRPYVALTFNPEGARLFKEITGANVGHQLAIVLDGVIHSAPVIQQEIPGGQAQITLGAARPYEDMLKEAQDIAIVLRAGALPVPLSFLEERTVGPTLGQDSIRTGMLALMIGSIAVVCFMAFYYKAAGLFADFALALNMLLILGILAVLQATLTLPGIAGIVLTIGMAVDANVIIYERIREELRMGKTAMAAVAEGFSDSLSTILDANITTLIAGIVLLQFGTGPIRGFAVTLIIGICTSVFTALVISKLGLEVMARRRGVIKI